MDVMRCEEAVRADLKATISIDPAYKRWPVILGYSLSSSSLRESQAVRTCVFSLGFCSVSVWTCYTGCYTAYG